MKHAVAALLVSFSAASGANAQSAGSPFGVPPKQLGAFAQWNRLPEPVKSLIGTRIAAMTSEQRREFLLSSPSLKRLSGAELDALLAQVNAAVPLPPAVEVTDASFMSPLTTLVTPALSQVLGQTFAALNSGELRTITLALLCTEPGAAGRPHQVRIYEVRSTGKVLLAEVMGNSPEFPTIGGIASVPHDFSSKGVQLSAGKLYDIVLVPLDRDHPPVSWAASNAAGTYTGGRGEILENPDLLPITEIDGDFGFSVTVLK
jgi:hypothetical protein